jgi:hypothetical protein
MALPKCRLPSCDGARRGQVCFDRPQPLWQWRAAIRDENAAEPDTKTI